MKVQPTAPSKYLTRFEYVETPIEDGELHALNVKVTPEPGHSLTLAANRTKDGAIQLVFLVNKNPAGQGSGSSGQTAA